MENNRGLKVTVEKKNLQFSYSLIKYMESFAHFQSVTKSVRWPYSPIITNRTQTQTSKMIYCGSLCQGSLTPYSPTSNAQPFQV